MPKYFLHPFANNGDRVAVPDESVTDEVSYEQGYTPAYELPKTNPDRRNIDRQPFNGALFAVTENLKFWQENGAPEIVADDGSGSPLSYSKGFVGSLGNVSYVALVDGTTTVPPSAEWQEIDLSTLNQRVIYVGSVAELSARTPIAGQVSQLDSGFRSGSFVFRTGDQSTNVTNDPEQGVWVAPDSDPTGASGAWMRRYDGVTGDASLNAGWFGTVYDGSTDDLAAAQAACDYAALSGGVVILSDHVYFSGTLNVPREVTVKGGGRVDGSSPNTRTRVNVDHNNDVFVLAGTRAAVSSLTVRHTGTPTGGHAVYAEAIANPVVEKLYIVGAYNGVYFHACNAPVADHVKWINLQGAFGIKTAGDGTLGNSDSHLFTDVSGGFNTTAPANFKHQVHGSFTNSGKTIGFRYVQGDYGVVLEGVTDDPDDIWFTQGGCDNQALDAFRFTTGQNLFLTDVWAGQAGNYGFIFATGFTGNVTAKGMRSRGSGFDGIRINGGRNFTLLGSLVGQNGTAASNTYAGLRVGDATSVKVQGGTYGDLAAGGSNQQQYGIVCVGSTDVVRVTDADLRGNLTKGFASSATGTDIRVKDCPGHVTENYGVSDVTLSGEIATLPTGLDRPAEFASVQINGSAENDRFVVDVVPGTNVQFKIFDVSTGATMTSGTHNVAWQAKCRH